MQKHVYRSGDKVRIKDQWVSGQQNTDGEMDHWLGKVMTIKYTGDDGRYYQMEEDQGEYCGSGWYWYPADFDLWKPQEKIVITSDGRVTEARMFDGKTLLKSAVATCSPDDAFDFATGAKIAVDRLLAESKPVSDSAPQYLTADAICFREVDGFVKGKVYHIENGFMEDDDGDLRPLSDPLKTPQEFRNCGLSRYLKLIDDIEP